MDQNGRLIVKNGSNFQNDWKWDGKGVLLDNVSIKEKVKTKVRPVFGFAGVIPIALEGAAVLAEAIVATGVAANLYNNSNQIQWTRLTLGGLMAEALVYSKGGKKNLWDDEVSPLSDQAFREWAEAARKSGVNEKIRKAVTEEKRRGWRNKNKRRK